MLLVESAFDWDDVGSWIAVAKYLADHGAGNVGNCDVSALDATGSIVFSAQKKRVALLGVSDLIVVDTPDALRAAQALALQRQGAQSVGE